MTSQAFAIERSASRTDLQELLAVIQSTDPFQQVVEKLSNVFIKVVEETTKTLLSENELLRKQKLEQEERNAQLEILHRAQIDAYKESTEKLIAGLEEIRQTNGNLLKQNGTLTNRVADLTTEIAALKTRMNQSDSTLQTSLKAQQTQIEAQNKALLLQGATLTQQITTTRNDLTTRIDSVIEKAKSIETKLNKQTHPHSEPVRRHGVSIQTSTAGPVF